ncbi:MAG: bifunctional UDP-N-acetylglucosamine diphosphorylase/glucosamine-1-phosphate N-acetyltransferase GlmU [Rhizobiales bacterium]|nr:bifunctional UDP-N-acetylglucosamine diphosphorylase/glucosamine-1-phosphate N-acetyltransferase GlmU [Hyphomicrobiales bacterium]
MNAKASLSIVLAAGEGTRMHSAKPKVLHTIAGRSMLGHVLAAVSDAGVTATAVVIGPAADQVSVEAKRWEPHADVFMQSERRGTAHAVLAAKAVLERSSADVLVIFGDTPLVRAETLIRMRQAVADDFSVAVAGFKTTEPSGYGRLVMKQGKLVAIREEHDASDEERAIGLCNGGLMAFAGGTALDILTRIGNDNRKKEFYLTDSVDIACKIGLRAVAIEIEEDDVRGINTKAQLAEAEAIMQRRLRKAALEKGVTMTAPETVFLSADTKLGRDVTVEPYVFFGPDVIVENNAVIHSFSHLVGAHVGEGASVGPFARLRPGTKLGKGARIGNFVEVKAAVLEDGAKANHLTYIGDTQVGAEANIGAGTITCNFDGFSKHRTEIGAGAFIGSNSALVAPVKIGDGAYIASGSVITSDVPADALAIARGRQVVKEGFAARLRRRKDKGTKADDKDD